MKKITFAAGLFIALIGIAVMTSSVQPYADVAFTAIKQEPHVWQITCNLTEGDRIDIAWIEPLAWSDDSAYPSEYSYEMPDYPPYYPILMFYVNVTPMDIPGNSSILYEEKFNAQLSISGYSGRPFLFNNWSMVVNGNLEPVYDDKGRLAFLGGKVLSSGTYSVSLTVYPTREEAPSYFGIYHNVTTTRYPESYRAYMGGTIIAVGGVISFLGVRSANQRTERKKLRDKLPH